MAIDYVFWLTEDNSERVAQFFAEKISKKFRSLGFYSVPMRITEDFTLTDYNEAEYEAFNEFRSNAIIASALEVIEKDEKDEKDEKATVIENGEETINYSKISIGAPKEDDSPTEKRLKEYLQEYYDEHPTLFEHIPIKKGQVCLLVNCRQAHLSDIKKFMKNERINYTHITEWINDDYFPPKYTEVIK